MAHRQRRLPGREWRHGQTEEDNTVDIDRLENNEYFGEELIDTQNVEKLDTVENHTIEHSAIKCD